MTILRTSNCELPHSSSSFNFNISCLSLRLFIYSFIFVWLTVLCRFLFWIFFFLGLIFLFFVSLFVCYSSLYLSFGLSEDDSYVDKLPTFERHFDSFAGIVTCISERRKGTRLGKGFEECSFVSFQSVWCSLPRVHLT